MGKDGKNEFDDFIGYYLSVDFVKVIFIVVDD